MNYREKYQIVMALARGCEKNVQDFDLNYNEK